MSTPTNGNTIQKAPVGPMATIKQLFEATQSKLASLVPRHLTPERLVKVALNNIAKTPALQKCSPASLLQCVITCAELGLEPGGALGHAYLVPFGNACTLIIGYRGFIELARRSGHLAQIETHVVHANDTFKVQFGLDPKLEHTPNLTDKPGEPVLVYLVARLKDGSNHVEVMTWREVMGIKARARSQSNGPWTTDPEEMARKTIVRRAAKYLPMSAELARAVEVDDEDFIDGEVGNVAIVADAAAPSAANEKAKAALKARKMEIVDIPDEPAPPADGAISDEEAASIIATENAQAKSG